MYITLLCSQGYSEGVLLNTCALFVKKLTNYLFAKWPLMSYIEEKISHISLFIKMIEIFFLTVQ